MRAVSLPLAANPYLFFMDKNQIITLLVNAVVTIVTTAVVVRLSLNKGSIGIANKVKARLTPKLIMKMILISSLLAVTYFVLSLYWFISSNPDRLATRFEVFYISFTALFILLSSGNILRSLRELKDLKELEKLRARSDASK
jgi:hypothetical protein